MEGLRDMSVQVKPTYIKTWSNRAIKWVISFSVATVPSATIMPYLYKEHPIRSCHAMPNKVFTIRWKNTSISYISIVWSLSTKKKKNLMHSVRLTLFPSQDHPGYFLTYAASKILLHKTMLIHWTYLVQLLITAEQNITTKKRFTANHRNTVKEVWAYPFKCKYLSKV